jgi:hypothetical protein
VWPSAARVALARPNAKWRTFEVVTRVEPASPAGVTRVWAPVPLMSDADYFRRLGDGWKGNAAVARLARDEKYDAGFVYAEWPATESPGPRAHQPILDTT